MSGLQNINQNLIAFLRGESLLLEIFHEIFRLKHGGFAVWVNYKVVVQGFSYKTVKLSKEDQIKERCLELQRCSNLFELAPTGQISALGFSSLDEQINLSCR